MEAETVQRITARPGGLARVGACRRVTDESDSTALVSHIERGSSLDGPGMRTVIFFKGCPLSCAWCHNPETIAPHPELLWERSRCLGCRKCAAACPDCLAFGPDGLIRSRPACERAYRCVPDCPGRALSVAGENLSAPALMATIGKDRRFYASFEGGVTFSGGEPLMQIDALTELAERCRTEGIHTALDTTCCGPWTALKQVLPVIDLLIGDLKIFDSETHLRHTGVRPEPLRQNLSRADHDGVRIRLRTPIIPGINDDVGNMRRCAEYASGLKNLDRYELLPFNPLAELKYERLGRPYALRGTTATPPETMHLLLDILISAGLPGIIL